MNQMDLLLSRMEDLMKKALKTGCAFSRFLTPAEARGAGDFFKHKPISPSFDGGYTGAERVRGVFVNPDWGSYEPAEVIGALKLSYRPQDNIGHRDILGALMALGIERDTIGDIIVSEDTAFLFCLPELCGYITENLHKAGRVGLDITQVGLDEIPEKTEAPDIKTKNVASLRLDAVLGAAFGMSRAKSAAMIIAGGVSLDFQVCTQPAKDVKEGAMISARGLGRARLLEVSGVSKKNRLFVKIGVYGR